MKHIRDISEMTPRMAQIHTRCFDYGWDDSVFAEYLNKPHHNVYGLFVDDNLKAFVLSAIISDEAEILTLATDPDYQRKGYASELMAYLTTQLNQQGIRSLFLEVAVDNPAAILLYEGLGFQAVGKRKAYYSRKSGPPVDARILSLALGGA